MNSPRFLDMHPLVPAAGLFVGGLALARWFDPPAIFCLAVLAGMLLAWAWVDRRSQAGGCAALCVAILCAGAANYQLDQRYGPRTHIARFILDAQPRLLTCRVTTITGSQSAGSGTGGGPAIEQILAQMDSVRTSAGWMPATGRVLVKAPGQAHIGPGQQLQLVALAARPAGPGNPGEFDYAEYLRTSRIFAIIQVKHAGQIRVLDAGGTTSADILQRFRLALRSKLLGEIPRDEPDSGHTMVALLLGHRDSSISDISRAFAASGVAHLLAISGFHIVLIAGLAWFVLRWIIRRPRLRTISVGLLVALYIAATPCGPPVLRAGLVMGMLLLAMLLGRPAFSLNLLAAALIIVLAARPADFLDSGLQLSFIVTAGLITLVPRMYQRHLGRFLERRAAMARAIGTWRARGRHALWRAVSAMMVMNFAGSLLAMPLVAFHFHQINPLAFVTGILIVPFVVVGIFLALVQLLASLLGGWLGALTAAVSVRWTVLMVWILKQVAAIPFAAVPIRPPPWYLLMLLYGGIILWLMRRSLRLSRATALACGCLPLPLLAAWYTATAAAPGLHLWQLAAPHGACLIGQTAEGRTFIINAGDSSGQFDARIIEPFLRVEGISHIDMVLCTSFDPPHASAVADLLALHRPRHVFGSGCDPGRFSFADDLPRNLPLEVVSAGDRIRIGAAITLEILWPPAKLPPAVPYDQMPLLVCIGSGTHRALVAGPKPDAALYTVPGSLRPIDAVFFPGPGQPNDAALHALQGLSPALIVQDGPQRDSDSMELPDATSSALDSSSGCIHVMIANHRILTDTFHADR